MSFVYIRDKGRQKDSKSANEEVQLTQLIY